MPSSAILRWPDLRRLERTIFNEQAEPELDFRMEARGSDVLEQHRQSNRAAQSDLVDRRGACRVFGLADLEHRRHQIAGGRFPLHHGRTVSARGDPRTDRLADAISLHLCGDDVRRPQLDHLQRGGALYTNPWARL